MWLVKLGGSLSYDLSVQSWLDALAATGGGRVIVVPGGGPFADLVRDAQRHWGFDDEAAHRMALYAMQQNALLLAALCPALMPVESEADMRSVLSRGKAALWLPLAMTLGNHALDANWSVTSDSIAAWLAGHLNAERLILVKSCRSPGMPFDADTLSATGIVDQAFPRFARDTCFDTVLLDKSEVSVLQELLLGERPPPASAHRPGALDDTG